MNKLKSFLLVLFSTFTFLIFSQEPHETGEFGKGLKDLQNYNYQGALTHIENFLRDNPEIDEDTYSFACFIAGTSASVLGESEKSKKYLDQIINIPDLPDELKIQIYRSQLNNCIDLLLIDECESIASDLYELYKKTESLDILHSLFNYYLQVKDYDKALNFEVEISNIEIPKTINTMQDLTLISELHGIFMSLAMIYSEKEEWDNSLKYFFKCLDALSPLEDNEDRISTLYSKIANLYSRKGDKKNALKYQKLASDKSQLNEREIENEELKKILKNFNKYNGNEKEIDERFEGLKIMEEGILLSLNERHREALEKLQLAFSIFYYLNEYDYQIYVLNWLTHVYQGLGDAQNYNSAKEKIKQAIENNKIEDEVIALIVYSKYGEIIKKEGDIPQALSILERALDKAIKLYGKENIENFPNYYKVATLYLDLGELTKARRLIEQIKSLDLKSQVDKSEFYSTIILESYLLQLEGRLGEMIKLLEEYTDEIEKEEISFGTKSSLYHALGMAYIEIGDIEKSKIYKEKTLELDRMLYSENSPNYATDLANLSEIYALNGEKQHALDLALQACSIFENLYGKNNSHYIHSLQKVAGLYKTIDPGKSKELSEQVSNLWEKLYGENSREYAENLIWMNLDFSGNPSEQSLASVKKGITILKDLGFQTESFYQSFLNQYATMIFTDSNWKELYLTLQELLDVTRQYIRTNFLVMPENQRELLWKSIKNSLDGIELFSVLYSRYAVETKDYSLLNLYGGLCYDARLLKKGILLTSTRNIDELITKIDNPRLDELRQEIAYNLNLLNNNENYDVKEREKIERKINNLERDILSIIEKEGNFMDFINIKWQDIQNALWPGEIAIEFFDIPNPDYGYTEYGAVVLGDQESPITLSLFIDQDLYPFKIDEVNIYDYNNSKFYDKIWADLELFYQINNSHTIYFSPEGILNTISIENLCDSNNILAGEKRNLYRLTSTREILNQNRQRFKDKIKDNQGLFAVLYGGLQYDSDLTQNVQERQFSNLEAELKDTDSPVRSFKDGARYLPGTLNEVDKISEILEGYQKDVKTGENGTEESFRAYSPNTPLLMHVATHGFYMDENEIKNYSATVPYGYNFLTINNRDFTPSTEILAMKGSGLLFSGANKTLMGKYLQDPNNDGILTAEELSSLELNGIDLGVLSACETGLGSVSEEGVFGLQRGFKLAGVHSILMSLWKVNDVATSLLMQNFYENLLNGDSKVQALRSAQDSLRKSKRFKDPKYWAGFVLLDAID